MRLLSLLFDGLFQIAKTVVRHLNDWFKTNTKPNNARLNVGAAFDLIRSKSELMAENALLRQQLIVLNRQIKHLQLPQHDRLRLVFLASLVTLDRSPHHRRTTHLVEMASAGVALVLETEIQINDA